MTQPQQPQREPNFQAVAGNLQQRIAEQAARYEGELALLREQFEYELGVLKDRVDEQAGQQNVVEPQNAAPAPTPVD